MLRAILPTYPIGGEERFGGHRRTRSPETKEMILDAAALSATYIKTHTCGDTSCLSLRRGASLASLKYVPLCREQDEGRATHTTATKHCSDEPDPREGGRVQTPGTRRGEPHAAGV